MLPSPTLHPAGSAGKMSLKLLTVDVLEEHRRVGNSGTMRQHADVYYAKLPKTDVLRRVQYQQYTMQLSLTSP